MASSIDSSGISFTALYTGAVWQRHGLSEEGLIPASGQALYSLLSPFEGISRIVAGGSVRTFLLQRHLIIDHLIEDAVQNDGVDQVLEIACGLSPRGIRLRRHFPHLRIVEADLPAMATRKAAFLASRGFLGEHHQVRPLDIFADSGPLSLETVIDEQLDTKRPLLVITEGLTSYFSLDDISRFWRRLASTLSPCPGSRYISETYLQPPNGVIGGGLNMLRQTLGAMTHAQVSFHFRNGEEAAEYLARMGFKDVDSENPQDYYGYLPIPQSRGNPLVRILNARI
ncbi:class I SAM-dependent methyltransferase [Marinobacter nanhaiticus D15-8W]|uniref:Class I SAM-dependent methyltransferase n=1 Tax=Marinobacter nanhaiticus D15-8W TaxID=626887 RepID=N6X7B9_9GAMM|nr:class I SAM-dependent methyltransferase [Marinobacter nanhaiticus]ENO17043.1 class I SAM-dependent methyltransferase [Marinobacter nanhaiticus D15-8W]BES71961.1 class I SAM-dependent methyltransferase [Marinobacter nanhaiticus D15-8W]